MEAYKYKNEYGTKTLIDLTIRPSKSCKFGLVTCNQ